MFSLKSNESWVSEPIMQCSAISSQRRAGTWHCCLGPKQFPLLTLTWFIIYSAHNYFNSKAYTYNWHYIWTKRFRRSSLLLYLLHFNRTWTPSNESLPGTVETRREESTCPWGLQNTEQMGCNKYTGLKKTKKGKWDWEDMETIKQTELSKKADPLLGSGELAWVCPHWTWIWLPTYSLA